MQVIFTQNIVVFYEFLAITATASVSSSCSALSYKFD
jgi:hypothetical protein